MKLIVGFSKSKKKFPIASWTIRGYQGFTEYSHTYIRLYSKSFPGDHIIHASEGKIQRMSEVQFDLRHEVVDEFEIEIPDIMIYNIYRNEETDLRRLFYDTIWYYSGDDYSIKQNIGIVIVHLLRVFGIKASNPWKKGWNCSEFVAVLLKMIIPEELEHIDPNLVLPSDLHKLLISLSESEQITSISRRKP